MIKLMELIAGKHDVKETLEIYRTITKAYGVNPKFKWTSKTDMYAHYDLDRGVIELSKTLNKNPKEFLFSLLHEIDHAMMAKKYGVKKFKEMYEYEMNYQIAKGKDEYDDNKYEIQADKFAKKNISKWVGKYIKNGKLQMRK